MLQKIHGRYVKIRVDSNFQQKQIICRCSFVIITLSCSPGKKAGKRMLVVRLLLRFFFVFLTSTSTNFHFIHHSPLSTGCLLACPWPGRFAVAAPVHSPALVHFGSLLIRAFIADGAISIPIQLFFFLSFPFLPTSYFLSRC